VAAVNALGAVMDEGGEYRITRSKGRGPVRSPKVIFRHLDEAPAWRFYKRTRPRPGYIIALWRPDGTLIACTTASGSRQTDAAAPGPFA
jgi:hypothetical protein